MKDVLLKLHTAIIATKTTILKKIILNFTQSSRNTAPEVNIAVMNEEIFEEDSEESRTSVSVIQKNWKTSNGLTGKI